MRSSFEAAWVVRSGRGERECRAPFEVNRGFSQFRTGAQSGGKPEALRGHRGPSLSLAEPREGLRGRSGAPRGVTRAGSARGEGSDASCGGQIARSRARGVSRRTPPRAPRGAQPPRQLPRFTLPPHHARRGPELGKKTCEGERAVRGARAAFEARRRSGGSPEGWDRMHSRPRRRPRGDPARSITPNPAPTPPGGALDHPSPHERTRKPRKVNREKESRVEAVDPTRRRRRAWLIHGHRCGLCAPQRARIRS